MCVRVHEGLLVHLSNRVFPRFVYIFLNFLSVRTRGGTICFTVLYHLYSSLQLQHTKACSQTTKFPTLSKKRIANLSVRIAGIRNKRRLLPGTKTTVRPTRNHPPSQHLEPFFINAWERQVEKLGYGAPRTSLPSPISVSQLVPSERRLNTRCSKDIPALLFSFSFSGTVRATTEPRLLAS